MTDDMAEFSDVKSALILLQSTAQHVSHEVISMAFVLLRGYAVKVAR